VEARKQGKEAARQEAHQKELRGGAPGLFALINNSIGAPLPVAACLCPVHAAACMACSMPRLGAMHLTCLQLHVHCASGASSGAAPGPGGHTALDPERHTPSAPCIPAPTGCCTPRHCPSPPPHVAAEPLMQPAGEEAVAL
jgi:hypothetical protein